MCRSFPRNPQHGRKTAEVVITNDIIQRVQSTFSRHSLHHRRILQEIDVSLRISRHNTADDSLDRIITRRHYELDINIELLFHPVDVGLAFSFAKLRGQIPHEGECHCLSTKVVLGRLSCNPKGENHQANQ